MNVLTARWTAKYGHFCRAEANRTALTYPLPPRTAVLGLLGAILGLEKDRIAVELGDIRLSVSGEFPRRFWHRVKLRKDPPTELPWSKPRPPKGTRPEEATLVLQEWLWKPDFRIHCSCRNDSALFDKLESRIRKRQWHFTPCMGLSELLCDLAYESVSKAAKLPRGVHEVSGYCPAGLGKLVGREGLAIRLTRMPYGVSEDRVFTHQSFYLEHHGRPIPVETDSAWSLGEEKLFLI